MSSSELPIGPRRAPTLASFFSACAAGDIATLRDLLASEPGFVRERTAEGSTGLHLAVRHVDAVRRQLERASAVLAGAAPAIPEARFTADLHDTLYGEREFTIVDLNGYELNFAQTLKR
jgi:hypothetical protein